jgi:hypothetical protein
MEYIVFWTCFYSNEEEKLKACRNTVSGNKRLESAQHAASFTQVLDPQLTKSALAPTFGCGFPWSASRQPVLSSNRQRGGRTEAVTLLDCLHDASFTTWLLISHGRSIQRSGALGNQPLLTLQHCSGRTELQLHFLCFSRIDTHSIKRRKQGL